MIGLPTEMQTKKDWHNAADYAIKHKTGIGTMIEKLESLRDDIYINVLKDSSKEKPADEQTPDDYEKVENPACEKIQLGFTDTEINQLIAELKAAK